jgi:hypothetical protein
MGSVKLYAPVPKLADDATVLLWEPWRAEINVEQECHDDSQELAGEKSLVRHGPFGESSGISVSFLPIPVHHANRRLSCLWVSGQKCERCNGDGKAHGADRPFEWSADVDYGKCVVCKGNGYFGTTSEGRDAAGNSVRLELGPVEIGFEFSPLNDILPIFPPCLVTAPMRVKVTVTLPDWKYRSEDRKAEVATLRTLTTTVSLPSLAVRHPMFPCEGEGVWSELGELKE